MGRASCPAGLRYRPDGGLPGRARVGHAALPRRAHAACPAGARCGAVMSRPGTTLVECMVAGSLGCMLLVLLATTLILQERIARAQAEHLAVADALRMPAEIIH